MQVCQENCNRNFHLVSLLKLFVKPKISIKLFKQDLPANEIDMIFTLQSNPGSVRQTSGLEVARKM